MNDCRIIVQKEHKVSENIQKYPVGNNSKYDGLCLTTFYNQDFFNSKYFKTSYLSSNTRGNAWKQFVNIMVSDTNHVV